MQGNFSVKANKTPNKWQTKPKNFPPKIHNIRLIFPFVLFAFVLRKKIKPTQATLFQYGRKNTRQDYKFAIINLQFMTEEITKPTTLLMKIGQESEWFTHKKGIHHQKGVSYGWTKTGWWPFLPCVPHGAPGNKGKMAGGAHMGSHGSRTKSKLNDKRVSVVKALTQPENNGKWAHQNLEGYLMQKELCY